MIIIRWWFEGVNLAHSLTLPGAYTVAGIGEAPAIAPRSAAMIGMHGLRSVEMWPRIRQKRSAPAAVRSQPEILDRTFTIRMSCPASAILPCSLAPPAGSPSTQPPATHGSVLRNPA